MIIRMSTGMEMLIIIQEQALRT